MSHVRCFAHAVVTAVALVAWGGVAWLMFVMPPVDTEWRLGFFAILGVAIGASTLAVFPVIVFSYMKRHTDLLESTTALEAAWNLGCASGVRKERRRAAALYADRPLRAVSR